MIQIGIVGSAGYVAGELLRCLVHHPEVKINFIYSTSQAGKKVGTIHQDLVMHQDLVFTDTINPDVDVLFLCLGHGNSSRFLRENSFSKATRVIDLSNDFRLKDQSTFENRKFIYGLVELNKSAIINAENIANPGCFATCIQLGLLPLASKGLLADELHVNAITGSTGAGQSLKQTSHFSWRNNNISIYKAFQHQHLGEITESVVSLQDDFSHTINFIPVRGDFTRGIFATIYTSCALSETELVDLYQSYYEDSLFTFVSDQTVNLKQVVNTNNCLIQVQKIGDKVLITSALDNLLRGAAGQALQNMNLMFGLDEKTGINFKASYF